jgi:uncharacterized protein
MSRLSVEPSAIPQDGISRHFSSTGSALGIVDTDLSVTQPVEIDCQLHKVDQEVLVRGQVRSAVQLTCSRCAEEFVQPLCLTVEAVYLPMQAISSERAQELEAGETDVYGYTEALVDLAEMVRDKLLLSVPLQPHCTVACKGLCPSCGVNRNTISCQCAEEKLGSPFESLKGLRFS